MEHTILNSREWAKFKREFVGPVLKRKQRIQLAPPMPAEKPAYISKYKSSSSVELTKEERRKALHSAYVVERRKKRNNSIPPWADRTKIRAMYLKARELTKLTGVKHEVDHIIPSNHPLVCGLHVESNLQILTEAENIKKSNYFEIM